MIKCKKCKEKFMSNIAYAVHVRMREKVGRKSVCPTDEELKLQGMGQHGEQWLFDAPAIVESAMLPPEPTKPVVVAKHSEIPPEHMALYQAYLAKVMSNKLPRLMWVVLDYGHQIWQFEKKIHVEWTLSHLTSGVENNAHQAVEAMGRTLGEWRSR